MRAVVQRVGKASVTVASQTISSIGNGLLVLLGVGQDDTEDDSRYLAEKIAGLRIFPDKKDKMNLSVTDVRGEVMVISQFTLFGDVRHGKRPSFAAAARPEKAIRLYESVVEKLRANDIAIATGRFRAMMDVSIVNRGPVTILLDSRKDF